MSESEKKPLHPDVELGMELSKKVAKLNQAARDRIAKLGLDKQESPSVSPSLTELHEAIAEKSLKKVNACIRQGVDVNALHSDFEWGFPLSHALDVGDLRILRALLKAGANPNLGDCIAISIEDNNLSLAKLLIEYGADLDGQPTWEKDEFFETNLIRAARLDLTPFVKLLLEAGADPNRHDGNNESALFVARMNKSKKLIELLEQYVSEDELAWVNERFSEAYAERLRVDKEIYQAIYEGETDRVLELIRTSKRSIDALLESDRGSPLEEALGAYGKAIGETRPKQSYEQMIKGEKQGEPDYSNPKVIATRQTVHTLLDLGRRVQKLEHQ